MAEAVHIVDRPVKLTSTHGKEVATTLRVQEWTGEQRTKRVWKRLGLWWGCALFAGLVPPHIPWFSIGFLGGPIAAWLTSRQRGLVQKQELACPECGAIATVDEQAETWPFGVRCGPCRDAFWVNQPAPTLQEG